MVNSEIFGYIGIVFAMIYRIPQIIKIYKNKKGEDISTKTFVLHNCAYIFLLIYISIKTYCVLELRNICKQIHDWTLYINTGSCGFCLKQLEFLGFNAKHVNIIHCDDKKNIRECSNIQEFPHWKKGTKSLPGARLSIVSLKELLRY